jgi:hypothetical protein
MVTKCEPEVRNYVAGGAEPGEECSTYFFTGINLGDCYEGLKAQDSTTCNLITFLNAV